jgi:DNA polymerase-3 subunit beta
MAKTFTFTAPAEEITGAIERVSKVGRSSVSVLGGVHMALEGKELTVQMTDMSLVLREKITVTRAGEGTRVVLDAAKVLKGLRTLEGPITFKGTKDALAILNGATTLRYAQGVVEDWPKLPEGPSGSAVTCPTQEFGWTFDTIKDAISNDQTRPVLTGVYMQIDEGRVRLTATDSYRLASDSCSTNLAARIDTFPNTLVNGKDLATVLRFIGKPEEITFSHDEKWLVVTGGERIAYLRKIDGQFPEYRKLIPESWECTVLLDRRAALKAFDRMRKLSTDNRPAKLQEIGGNEMLVSIYDPDLGGNLIETRIGANWRGNHENGFPYGINPSFMYDALQAIGGDHTLMHAVSALRPSLLTVPDWNHTRERMPDRFYLVMPIRLH